MALSLSTSLAFDVVPASASSRCSVETNSSFIAVGFGLGRFEHLAQSSPPSCGGAPPLDLGQMLQLGVDDLLRAARR